MKFKLIDYKGGVYMTPGTTFAPGRIHSGSLSWLYNCFVIPSQNVMPARVTPA